MSLLERSGAKRVAETEPMGSKLKYPLHFLLSRFLSLSSPLLFFQLYVFSREALPTAPASIECPNFLTHCINSLLAGILNSCLAPWFCRLLWLSRVVGETLHRLVSKVCCSPLRSSLPDLLLSFGQVGVGILGGLETAACAFHPFHVWFGLFIVLFEVRYDQCLQ